MVILKNRSVLTAYLVVLGLIFSLIQCSKKNKVVRVYSSEGILQEEFEATLDSVRQGKSVYYYENGDTFSTAYYHNGKLEGERLLYFPGNIIEVRENYLRDTLVGKHETFYESGQLKRSVEYRNNVMVGTLKLYYENGNLKEEVAVSDNMENGPFIEYYENGQKSWEGTYEKGENEIGLLVQFAENGDTIRKMMCDERYICRTIYRNEKYPEGE